jgi:sulfur relay protein TusB/DsrH
MEGPMKLGVFVSDYTLAVDTLERLKSEELGIFLVQNGVYHAAIRDRGKRSAILDAAPRVYALREDLEARGVAVDAGVAVVGYGEIVDLIVSDYPRLAWL